VAGFLTPIISMETKLSSRFWRVALWGALTFLLLSISFWHFFGASIAVQVGKKEAIFSVPPNPFLPTIVSGVLALLFVMLGMAALWWLQSGRKPVPLRHRFASHKGNANVIAKINPILRGWVNYFRVGHSSSCFSMVKQWVERKVRQHLMRARGRRGFGWQRWSSEWLYARLGLFNDYQLRRWSDAKVAPAQ
jgi:hypothetical protein